MNDSLSLSLSLPPSLFLSAARNYQNAFNEIKKLFNPLRRINPILKFLIIITDDPEYNFDGAKFDNTESIAGLPPNFFGALVYSTRGECAIITGTFIYLIMW